MYSLKLLSSLSLTVCVSAWTLAPKMTRTRTRINHALWSSPPGRAAGWASSPTQADGGNVHGQNACFLPLEQVDQEFYAPRIVQIAGAYPGLKKEDFLAVTSEPPAEMGQWSYDFSDPDGPQLGTVAVRGCEIISGCEDPVAIICDHFSLGVPLPEILKDPVDLLAIVDRAKTGFAERKFLVVEKPDGEVLIRGFGTKAELPENGTILGRVVFVQIPWLPCMKPNKSGFMEEDELF